MQRVETVVAFLPEIRLLRCHRKQHNQLSEFRDTTTLQKLS